MLNRLMCVHIKSKSQPLHWDEKLKVIFILQGEAALTVNNRQERLKAGSISIVNIQDVHSLDKLSDDLIYIQLMLNMEEFNQYMPEISTVYFKCGEEESDIVSESVKDGIKNYIAQITRLAMDVPMSRSSEQAVIYYCIETLSDLKMKFTYMKAAFHKEVSFEKTERLWKVLDYVYDNYSRKLTLKEVSDHIFTSTSYLSRLIKEQTGETFEVLLGFIRSEMSLKYLLNTELSITNIAYECGFSSPRYYYSAFEKNYGCSPAEYRKKNKALFLMEKSNSGEVISYDAGIDKKMTGDLLSSYRVLDVMKDPFDDQIVIDVGKDIKQNGVLKHIDKFQSDPVETLDAEGEPTVEYYIYRALRKSKSSYMVLGRNCILYDEAGQRKIIAFETEEKKKTELHIQLVNTSGENNYLVRIETVREMAEEMREILREAYETGALSETELRSIKRPEVKYDIFKTGNPFTISVEFSGRGCMEIAIKKIK